MYVESVNLACTLIWIVREKKRFLPFQNAVKLGRQLPENVPIKESNDDKAHQLKVLDDLSGCIMLKAGSSNRRHLERFC